MKNNHRRFFDNAGYGNHCWECVNSADWHSETGRCIKTGKAITKYDSPNNCCSAACGCWSYERR